MELSRSGNFNKILILSFGLMFGLVALAMIFSSVTTGRTTDIRSRAAQEEIVLKDWTFDANAEGWTAADVMSSKAANGYFEITMNRATTGTKEVQECRGNGAARRCTRKTVSYKFQPRISQDNAGIQVLSPDTKIKVTLAASRYSDARPSVSGTDNPSSENDNQAAFTMPMMVFLQVKGRSTFEAPMTVEVPVDTLDHEYVLAIPSTLSRQTIGKIKLEFDAVKSRPLTNVKVNGVKVYRVKDVAQTTPVPRVPGLTKGALATVTGELNMEIREGRNITNYQYHVRNTEYGSIYLRLGGKMEAWDQFIGKNVRVTGYVDDSPEMGYRYALNVTVLVSADSSAPTPVASTVTATPTPTPGLRVAPSPLQGSATITGPLSVNERAGLNITNYEYVVTTADLGQIRIHYGGKMQSWTPFLGKKVMATGVWNTDASPMFPIKGEMYASSVVLAE